LFCLLIFCVAGMTTSLAAQNQPDLIPVVVDANHGYIEVRNIGDAVAGPSQLFVICSMIRSGRPTVSCATGLHLPGFIEKWNTLPFDIPALQPGSKYPLHLFGSGSFPRPTDAYYGMRITIDPRKKIAESNEENNYTRLDTTPDYATQEEGLGLLHIKVLMDGKPVKSAIVVTRPANPNRVVLQTESMPGRRGRQMQQTPFEESLPVGKYDLYVHTELMSPLKIYLQTKAMPIVIKKGEQLEKTVTIPSGHLQLSTTVEGKKTTGVKVSINGSNSNFKSFSSNGILETPVNVTIPAGSYTLRARNVNEKQTQTVSVDIKAGSVIKKSLKFDKLRIGYLKLNLIMDGKVIPYQIGRISSQQSLLADVDLISAETGEAVTPLETVSDGDRQSMKLRVGVYDLKVHERTIGGKEIVIKGIAIRERETVEKTVAIQPFGTLNLKARWIHQPVNLLACAVYHNPINLNRLGALMGGGSGAGGRSRGDCFSPDVSLAASVSSLGRSDGNIAKEIYPKRDTTNNDIKIIKIEPGVYDVAVWPVGHREMEQTLKGVEIVSDGNTQRKLEFRWPGKK